MAVRNSLYLILSFVTSKNSFILINMPEFLPLHFLSFSSRFLLSLHPCLNPTAANLFSVTFSISLFMKSSRLASPREVSLVKILSQTVFAVPLLFLIMEQLNIVYKFLGENPWPFFPDSFPFPTHF